MAYQYLTSRRGRQLRIGIGDNGIRKASGIDRSIHIIRIDCLDYFEYCEKPCCGLHGHIPKRNTGESKGQRRQRLTNRCRMITFTFCSQIPPATLLDVLDHHTSLSSQFCRGQPMTSKHFDVFVPWSERVTPPCLR